MGASFAFGRERRLRKRAEFLRVQSTGRRVSTPHFTLLVAISPEASAPSRLGVVTTRKLGGAVKRNRIKRVCRECFRLWPELLPNGVDLVVIAKLGADALALSDVRREWEDAHRVLRKRAAEALAQTPPKHHVSARAGAPSGRRP